jgi:hypothetical protein
MKERTILLLSLLIFLVGCQRSTAQFSSSGEELVSPTDHQYFSTTEDATRDDSRAPLSSQNIPTIASVFSQRGTATPISTDTPAPTEDFPTSKPTSTDYITLPVYADEFNQDWQMLQEGMEVSQVDTSNTHQGMAALSVTPLKDYGKLFFGVKPETSHAYPRSAVVGISLWINGGNNSIATSDLAVAIVGSNQYPYWDPEDRSVYYDAESPFSETRLYYLGFNHSIPPNTWVEIEVLIDNLIYDPDYKYVTGFYLKNDIGFLTTFYVDDVKLILLNGESLPLITTATPTPQKTVTPQKSSSPSASTPVITSISR